MEYQKQKNSTWCGVACLSMVYEHFGLTKSQEELYYEMQITNSVFENGNVSVVGILKHILNNTKLSACVIKVIDASELFDFVLKNNMKMIMLHKARFSHTSHFTIFDKIENETIYGFDTNNEDLFPIDKEEMLNLWKENWTFGIAGNIAILVTDRDCNKPCANTKSTRIKNKQNTRLLYPVKRKYTRKPASYISVLLGER